MSPLGLAARGRPRPMMPAPFGCRFLAFGPPSRSPPTSLRPPPPSPQPRTLGEQLRLVMRASAQPVAIITAFLPPPGAEEGTRASAFLQPKRTYPSHTAQGGGATRTLVHGATLSSFSSVSLDPPRVAFSLRVPSRLADALLHDALANMSPSSPASSAPGSHFVVSLLSSHQADIARTYAHPGLAPYDVTEKKHSASPTPSEGDHEVDDSLHPLDTNAIAPSKHAHAHGEPGQGVPYLVDAVGALACRITRVVDLTVSSPDQEGLGNDDAFRTRLRAAARTPGTLLFIAEVCGVDRAPPQEQEAQGRPLLYCDRTFVTVDDHAL